MPKPGDELTKEQVAEISNLSKYTADADDVTIDKNWHQGPETGGQYEGWAADKESGYGNGYPLYAGVIINKKKLHVYWLPLTNEMKLAGIGGDPRKN
jgi:hypothetical protein